MRDSGGACARGDEPSLDQPAQDRRHGVASFRGPLAGTSSRSATRRRVSWLPSPSSVSRRKIDWSFLAGFVESRRGNPVGRPRDAPRTPPDSAYALSVMMARRRRQVSSSATRAGAVRRAPRPHRRGSGRQARRELPPARLVQAPRWPAQLRGRHRPDVRLVSATAVRSPSCGQGSQKSALNVSTSGDGAFAPDGCQQVVEEAARFGLVAREGEHLLELVDHEKQASVGGPVPPAG